MAARLVTSASKIVLRDVVPGAQAQTELTIASGSVTPTRHSHTIDTEGDASSDNLDTIDITNLRAGDEVDFTIVNAARITTVRDGVGNITTVTGQPIVMDDLTKTIRMKVNAAETGVVAWLAAGGSTINSLAELKNAPFASGASTIMGFRSSANDGGFGIFNADTTDLSALTVFSTVSVSSIDGATDQVTCGANHNARDGDGFIATAASGGFAVDTLYFARKISDTIITAHPTAADAYANTNKVDLSSASGFSLKFLSDPMQAVFVIPTGLALDGTQGAWRRQLERPYIDIRLFGAACDLTVDDYIEARAMARLSHALSAVNADQGYVGYCWRGFKTSKSISGDIVPTDGWGFVGDGPEVTTITCPTDGVEVFAFDGVVDQNTPPKGIFVRDMSIHSTVTNPTAGAQIKLRHVNEVTVSNVTVYGGWINIDIDRVANDGVFDTVKAFKGVRTGLGQAVIHIHSSSNTRNNSSLKFSKIDIMLGDPEDAAITRQTVSSVDDTNDEIVFGAAHSIATGRIVSPTVTNATGLVGWTPYYARAVSSTRLSVHPSYADAIANTNKINLSASGGGWALVVASQGISRYGWDINNCDGIYIGKECHVQGCIDAFQTDPDQNTSAIRRIYSIRADIYIDSSYRFGYKHRGTTGAANDYDYLRFDGEVQQCGLDGISALPDGKLTNLIHAQNIVRNCGRLGADFGSVNLQRPKILLAEYRDNNTLDRNDGGDVQVGGISPVLGGNPAFTDGGSSTTGGKTINVASGTTGAWIDAPGAEDSPRTTKYGNAGAAIYTGVDFVRVARKKAAAYTITSNAITTPYNDVVMLVGTTVELHTVPPGLYDGHEIELRMDGGSSAITAKSGTDPKFLLDGSDFLFNNKRDALKVRYDTADTNWYEVSRSG